MSTLAAFAGALYKTAHPIAYLLSLSEAELAQRGLERDALARSYMLGQAR